MPSKKTVFNDDWLKPDIHPDFAIWLKSVKEDSNKASCKYCNKTFSLSNMGIQAIKSHVGPKHLKNVRSGTQRQVQIETVFESLNPPVASTSSMVSENAEAEAPPSSSTPGHISSYLVKENVTSAEILWALRLVNKRQSFHSLNEDNELFKRMFPDSQIAQGFAMKEKKAKYIISYGLAPYFRDLLQKSIDGLDSFVICFDEALNKISQRGQMDIHIRFWDKVLGRISTRYLNSVFMGHATAKDILVKFKEGISPLKIENILQISMDGPNVNWSFLNLLKAEKESEPNDRKILDLGSCGLHVLNGALQTGHNNVKNGVNDPLMLPKLAFFKTIASDLEPFLRRFQADKPLGPYLYSALLEVVQILLKRCVKDVIIESAKSTVKLLNIDLSDKEILLAPAKVDIGFGASSKLVNAKGLSDRQKLEFQMQCRDFAVATLKKILERSPLKYSLVKGISSLDPELIYKRPKIEEERMKIGLKILFNNNWVDEGVAERALQQFSTFCKASNLGEELKDKFANFLKDEGKDKNRLDDFYLDSMSECKYKDLWMVTQLILIISHGNADVESGFSINKGMLVENLHEDSLKALRQVNDGIAAAGGLKNICVDRKMLSFVKSARTKYDLALKNNIEKDIKIKEGKEAKKRKLKELKELKSKKQKLSVTRSLEDEELNKNIKKLETEILK